MALASTIAPSTAATGAYMTDEKDATGNTITVGYGLATPSEIGISAWNSSSYLVQWTQPTTTIWGHPPERSGQA
ncbi:hypothetical protein [uncultured Microbacterium sp.]|uniref:hypothetical protein n=1 Tax=uncultured Microbacterium sp. TaxID=191216 RepID=UPI0025FF76AB|nr:hypothetical protein [uncultured Microbacterium sp.]